MIYRVEFDVDIPPIVTEDETEEWLRFHLNDNGAISIHNPLEKLAMDVEPVEGTFKWWRQG